MKSAVKKAGAKTVFTIFLLLISFSCVQKSNTKISRSKNSSTEILSVKFSNVGGMQGGYRTFTATKDSLLFENGQSVNNIHKEWKSAMKPEIWKEITSAINISDLDKITSSPSRQPVDGSDETFQIKTSAKTHVFVNSYDDTANYRQLADVKNIFEKNLPKEYR